MDLGRIWLFLGSVDPDSKSAFLIQEGQNGFHEMTKSCMFFFEGWGLLDVFNSGKIAIYMYCTCKALDFSKFLIIEHMNLDPNLDTDSMAPETYSMNPDTLVFRQLLYNLLVRLIFTLS